MRLQTASEAITFLKQLEKQSADFYEYLEKHYEEQGSLFSGFAKENGKNIINIERTYYGVITDALEGCFAFDIDTELYKIDDKIVAEGNFINVLSQAIQLETIIRQFYIDAANQSRCLMADVPRVMDRIAKARADRLNKLNMLLEAEKNR